MATLDERIIKNKEKLQKAEKKIIKLQNKLDTLDFDKVTKDAVGDRFNKEHLFQYEKNELSREIKNAIKDKEKIQQILLDCEAKNSVEKKRNSIPEVPVIEEFLNQWAIKTSEYYNNSRQRLIKYKAEIKTKTEEIAKSNGIDINKICTRNDSDKLNEFLKKDKIDRKSVNDFINAVFPQFVILYCSNKDWDKKLEKEMYKEKQRKKIYFYTKITEVVGNVLDASDLRIASNGEINGLIIGDKNKATITTITAGGYNIQCFHFRVLIHVVK